MQAHAILRLCTCVCKILRLRTCVTWSRDCTHALCNLGIAQILRLHGTHTYIHTHIHTYTHTYIHTCIHTHIHIYTYTWYTYHHSSYVSPSFSSSSLPHSLPPPTSPLSLSSLPYLPTPPSTSPSFQSSFPDDFVGYEVLYWPISTTNYSSQLPPGRSTGVTLPLNSLRIFTRYAVAVRLYCSNGTGPASPVEEFETRPERKLYQMHVYSSWIIVCL